MSAISSQTSSMDEPPEMLWNNTVSFLCFFLKVCLLLALLPGCAAMPKAGASRQQIVDASKSARLPGLAVVDVTDSLARSLLKGKQQAPFSEVFKDTSPSGYCIGPGDVVAVSVWETPPPMLFGSIIGMGVLGMVNSGPVTLPPQMVMDDGKITVPFAGRIRVAGRTTYEIESELAARLQGKANHPQVLVSVSQSNTLNVTIIGDVSQSARMALTPKGERLLDALAAAGGITQPVTRMAVQLSRGSISATMPLDAIIRNPHQNIRLKPSDVVTALFQPQSFSVLGATGKNQEISFEAQGISLAQALARSGGLDDNRADPQGVFVFRFEDAPLVSSHVNASHAVNGVVPIIYQVDLRDPASFLITQNFPIQNQDVIYVANAPAAELEKFLRMVGMAVTPPITVTRFMQSTAE